MPKWQEKEAKLPCLRLGNRCHSRFSQLCSCLWLDHHRLRLVSHSIITDRLQFGFYSLPSSLYWLWLLRRLLLRFGLSHHILLRHLAVMAESRTRSCASCSSSGSVGASTFSKLGSSKSGAQRSKPSLASLRHFGLQGAQPPTCRICIYAICS